MTHDAVCISLALAYALRGILHNPVEPLQEGPLSCESMWMLGKRMELCSFKPARTDSVASETWASRGAECEAQRDSNQ